MAKDVEYQENKYNFSAALWRSDFRTAGQQETSSLFLKLWTSPIIMNITINIRS